MAMKKIRLDFSKVEERSGWNTRNMPEGLHKFKIESVQETEAQDGTDMLVYALRPTEGRYKTRLFPFYCKIQQNQLWKLRDLLVAAGQTVPKKAQQIDPSSVVGKFVAGEVEDETGQYAGRSTVNGIYGLEVLDDDGGAESDEDEEYEGDEDSDEEYDEDEDDDDDEGYEEDEEAEDLSALTLVELRKRAKGLGIDTAGLKKDDLIESIEEAESEEAEDDEDDDFDDDDLDDEELYDDEDDEDEEPEPAPKRRAPAKPAPKAAPARRAPAAKAAPAKRVVKRR